MSTFSKCASPYLSIFAIFPLFHAQISYLFYEIHLSALFSTHFLYTASFSLFCMGVYPSSNSARIPTLYTLYQLVRYPIRLLYQITSHQPPKFIRNWAAVGTSAEYRKRQPTWGLAS